MLQDLQWDTLETVRRYARSVHVRLFVMYKICCGFLDGKWEDYLIPNRERRTRGSHDFEIYCPERTQEYFRFSFFSRKITEWNKLVEKTVTSQSLSILAKFLALSCNNSL